MRARHIWGPGGPEKLSGQLVQRPSPKPAASSTQPAQRSRNQEAVPNLSDNLAIRVGQFSVQILGRPSVQINSGNLALKAARCSAVRCKCGV